MSEDNELRKDVHEIITNHQQQISELKGRIEKLEDSMKRISGTVQDKVWEFAELKSQLENIHKSVLFNNSEIFDIGSVLKELRAMLLNIHKFFMDKPNTEFLRYIGKFTNFTAQKLSGEEETEDEH